MSVFYLILQKELLPKVVDNSYDFGYVDESLFGSPIKIGTSVSYKYLNTVVKDFSNVILFIGYCAFIFKINHKKYVFLSPNRLGFISQKYLINLLKFSWYSVHS